MKDRITQVAKHPLISGSAIMVIGTLAGNVLNFLFNLYMIKNLSVVDYGVLASLNSLITLPALAAGAIVPTVVSFAGEYFAKNDKPRLSGLFFKISKYFSFLGGIVLVSFIIFSEQLAAFLHINNTTLIILSGIIVFFGFMGSVNLAFLQAKLLFSYIVGVNFLGALMKLILAVLLVGMGYSVGGAIVSYLIAFTIPFFLMLIPIRELFKNGVKREYTPVKELFTYGFPAALCMLSLTSFISTDILLVKHFFSATEAGIYAGISLIARIIFFISGPITSVMFPLIVQKHSRNEKYTHLLFISLFFVTLPSLVITFLYFLFPDVILPAFFKEQHPTNDTILLGYFGMYITIYSVISLLSNFFLSIKKTAIAIPLTLAACMQIILIWMYHSDFFQVILLSTVILCLLLVTLLLYYFKINSTKQNEKT